MEYEAVRDVTEWNTPFDPVRQHSRSDFDWMLGEKVKKVKRILAARNGLTIRVIGKGPKRYAIDMSVYNTRLNVAVSRWGNRIIYVDGIY
jgi:hypothetical protein